MHYDMELRGEADERYTLHLVKNLRERGSFKAWRETTTAYATVTDQAENVIGTGIVHVDLTDFLRLLASIDAPRAPDNRTRLRARLRFLWMFVRRLLSIYGGVLDSPGQFPKTPVPKIPVTDKRALKLGPLEAFSYTNGTWQPGLDRGPGTRMQLYRYNGGGKGPVLLSPGFAMSATSFLVNTIETNLVEYLYKRKYDVWLFDDRGSILLQAAQKRYSLDDVALEDWPAAVDFVRTHTNKNSVQVVAHCTGALTFEMAMLAGLQGVRSAVVSALTPFLVPSVWTKLKNKLRLEGVLARLFLGLRPMTRGTLGNQLVDILLRLHPIEDDERCGQSVCRFMNAIYGKVHQHAQLNNDTHVALQGMYGFGNLTAGKQYAEAFRKGYILDRDGRNVYVTNPKGLAIPLLILHGDRNTMFLPKGSERTYDWLREKNDPALYRREILRDYAHLDAFIGRNAHRDVFPIITDHLEKTAQV
jgi:cholesterol oxidase